ncbi:circadian clock-controlled protein daywake-like [Eurosta solidaginis]|uniref:circadian clock-controlled protein daywake-like n=1 Tax=Eurosta solidaginis TaxID=178769 RepID=UPI0035308D3D
MRFEFSSFTVLLAFVLQINNTSSKYLTEKPSYLKTCDFNAADLNSCFADSLKVLFNEWKDGVPGLKGLSPLEPLTIKRIKIHQNNGATFNLFAELENLILHGGSEVVIKNAVVDKKKLNLDVTVEIKKLHADGNYKAKGTVLGFNIDGQGPGTIDATNVLLQFHISAKIRDTDDFTFVDIIGFKSKIVKIGDFHVDVKNLFGGQTDLETTTNDVFNQNWRELTGLLRPALEQAIELVFKNHFTKIFAYVPANYFFANFPKASEFYV